MEEFLYIFDKLNIEIEEKKSFFKKENIFTDENITNNLINKLEPTENNVVLFSIANSPEEQDANNIIREYLYKLEPVDRKINFFDFGNVKQEIVAKQLKQALYYFFSESNASAKYIILCPNRKLLGDIIGSLPKSSLNITDINHSFDLYNTIKELTKQGKIQFYNLAGNLQFFYNINVNQNELNVEILRLGEIRNQMERLEPYLRESDMVINSLNAVSAAHSPSSSNPSPNGLSAYDFSYISFLTGICSRPKHLIYTGISENEYDTNHLSAQLIAQSIWLYLNTFTLAKDENPTRDKESSFFETIIHSNTKYNIELVFYHSTLTDRWWLHIPSTDMIVAISKQDYLACRQGDIPERLIKIIEKYTKL